MERKLPPDAYSYYLSLGTKRSYQAVADHFEVSKQTVTKRAVRENWQDRIAELERDSHARAEKKYSDTLDEMNDRHIKMYTAVLGKAIETLRAMPITTAWQAIRAIDMFTKNERMARELPTERTAMSVEQVLRDEFKAWMLKPGEEEDWSVFEQPAGGDEASE